jgi:hypothetical protein
MTMLADDTDVLALVRRYEPVIRYTAGELFLPMPVETYVQGSALWVIDPGANGKARLVVDHGHLDVDRLCAEANSSPGGRLQLRYVREPLRRRELRAWRRDPARPRLRTATRFAAVGLFGRLIDAIVRLSLVVRGNVPGGLTAAVHQKYRTATAGGPTPYYAHVSADGGYLVLQYWFLYPMNDWRSSFAGVNDHEADWEQVTIFLTQDGETQDGETPEGEWKPAWVAFSAHDEVGADLRRRRDDPDLSWVDGTHPVLYAGAGSHAGAYLPGEYLVRVEPTALAQLFRAIARIRSVLFPWTRGHPRTGLGIPYVDYKRGDGGQVGPGTGQPWQPVIIDDATGWVRDFRGLWGLDTADPFGGERAPAGPRYNRDGSLRESWADPVAWAGLDEVPPTAAARALVRAQRLSELDRRRKGLDEDIAAQQAAVRRASSAFVVRPRSLRRRGRLGAEVDEQSSRLRELRASRRALTVEYGDLRRQQDHPTDAPPHAHLHRRLLPDEGAKAVPGLLLRFWTEASLSVLLALLGIALLLNLASAPEVVVTAILIVMFVEAVLRRRVMVFLLAVAIVVTLIVLVWLVATNWRTGLGVLALLGSATLAIANLRSLMARR